MSASVGQQTLTSDMSDANAVAFQIKQGLARMATAMPVKVLSVTNSGGITPVGYVDVQPLVNQVDGAGNSVPHGTVHGLPYSRLQGGSNAVILDPSVGDIGVIVAASRDISAVKNTKAAANPGSFRRHDFADGMYVGAVLNGTPTQYVAFSGGGVSIYSPTAITLAVGGVSLEITSSGFTLSGGPVMSAQTGTFAGVIVDMHLHSGVTTGSDETGPPVAGT